MEQCKYRLPCGYCERINNQCKLLTKNSNKQNDNNCNHRWMFSHDNPSGGYIYVCANCDLVCIFPEKVQQIIKM